VHCQSLPKRSSDRIYKGRNWPREDGMEGVSEESMSRIVCHHLSCRTSVLDPFIRDSTGQMCGLKILGPPF
jgi:hypothetical protein